MSKTNPIYKLLFFILKLLFAVKENASKDLGDPKKILVIRQHNQFGDLLASISVFRAIKETYPETELNVLVSPDNFYAITKNKFIDNYFVFNKSGILTWQYLKDLKDFLKAGYDVVIVPATVSISATSCMLSRFSDADIRIGPEELDGKTNKLNFLFNHRVKLSWSKHPDAHVSDFSLDILRPFGINTHDFRSEITFDETDKTLAQGFILEYIKAADQPVIGFHVGAGKPPNRWPLENFVDLIKQLKNEFGAAVYLTGSSSDKEELEYVQKNLEDEIVVFKNKTIPQLAALIDESDLFVTNDTGVMHVAGTTSTAQISIFGPTNPFNWAPVGDNKLFASKSEFISDNTYEEIYEMCSVILTEKLKSNNE